MRRLLPIVLFCAFASCSKCGSKGAGQTPAITRHVPRALDGAVVIPELAAFGQRLAELETLQVANFAAQLQGLKDGHAFAEGLVSQLGVDVRSPEKLAEAGFDPKGGAAVVMLSDGSAYSVIAAKDVGKVKAFVGNLARTRLGAGVEGSVKVKDEQVTTFARAEGAPPNLALLAKDGFVFVAPNTPAEKLVGYATLPDTASLSGTAAVNASIKRLPEKREMLLFLGEARQSEYVKPVGPIVAAVGLSKRAITVDLDWPLGEMQAALGPLIRKEGKGLVGQLPSGTYFAAQFMGDPTSVAPHLRRAFGQMIDRAQAAGLDFTSEVLENLKPGIVVGLSMSPNIKLGQGMPEMDVRRTNPFQYVELTALADVKDAGKGNTTLAKLPQLAPQFGAKIEAQEKYDHKIYVTTYAQGEGVHFTQVGNRWFAAAPMSRMERNLEALRQDQVQGPSVFNDAQVQQVFDQRALAAVIDLRSLADAVRSLPNEAWGVGGFAIKATVLRWLEGLGELKAIVASAQMKEEAAQVSIALRLEPK